MFGSNKKDPLVDAVTKVMQENQIRRDVERQFNEDLGIESKRALPFEKHAEYDRVLAEKTQHALSEGYSMKKEALHPNQQQLDVHEPEKDKLTAKDFAMLRAKKKPKEMEEAAPIPGDVVTGIGSVTKNGKDVVSPTATRADSEPKSGSVPLPPPRPKDLKEMKGMISSKVRAKKMEEESETDRYIASVTASAGPSHREQMDKIKAAGHNILPRPGMINIPQPSGGYITKPMNEAAPKGAKFERMVKHIKAKYAKDGLTDKEKSIAYATAHKAKNKEEEND